MLTAAYGNKQHIAALFTKMKLNCLFLLFGLYLSGGLIAQDTLVKKNGEILVVKLIEVNISQVLYKPFDYPVSPTKKIDKKELKAIKYKNGITEQVASPEASETRVTVFRDTAVFSKPVPKAAKNVIFFEMGGNGGFYSLNYERLFPLKSGFALAARIGGSAVPQKYSAGGKSSYSFGWTEYGINTLPVSVSALYGKDHRVEFGIGYTPLFKTNGNLLYDFNNYIGAMMGYRFQRSVKDMFFKCGFIFAQNIDQYKGNSFPSTYIALGVPF
ncbi:MAG: hypothetical protein JST26_03595 [Bacteroidetes bacterium]|nr:hypothetical protein [Bacteroidota bacterium]